LNIAQLIDLPKGTFFIVAFYGFLHCWLNAFAEMLRFGDRKFYSVCLLFFLILLPSYLFHYRIGGQLHHGVVTIEHGML
jgi:hypothetical protein